MIKQDYIMQQVEMLTKFLEKIVAAKKEEHFPDARQTVDAALKEMTGIDYSLVQVLSESELLAFLNICKNEEVLATRCIVIAKLLKERADICCKDIKSDPIDDYRKAIRLYQEGIRRCTCEDVPLKEYYEDIRVLKAIVERNEKGT